MKRKTRFIFQILVLCLVSVMMLQACGSKRSVEYENYKVYVSSEQVMGDDYKLDSKNYSYLSFLTESEFKNNFQDKIRYELPWGTVEATKISETAWENVHRRGKYVLDNGDQINIDDQRNLTFYSAYDRLTNNKNSLLSSDIELSDKEIIDKAREYVIRFYGEEIASLYPEVNENLEWFSDDPKDKGDTTVVFRNSTDGILWSSNILVRLYHDGTLLFINNSDAAAMLEFNPESSFVAKVEDAISDWVSNNEIKYEIRDKLIVPIEESRFAVKVNIYITESNQRRDIWIYVPIQG